ncbi:hypothetical protein CRG98_043741 [Punica granatum]|uniref:Uncharacterized protein n=1 Tax=Punica granatum TaxID=22663 RepID=A0A2I0HW00_PUNGR|nr:hypothetical protein CRG98_043741 [Punica granatum]
MPVVRCTPILFRPSVGVGCLELFGLRAWSPAVLEEESAFGRLSSVGEPIGDRVGIDNLVISLEGPWSAQCAKA